MTSASPRGLGAGKDPAPHRSKSSGDGSRPRTFKITSFGSSKIGDSSRSSYVFAIENIFDDLLLDFKWCFDASFMEGFYYGFGHAEIGEGLRGHMFNFL